MAEQSALKEAIKKMIERDEINLLKNSPYTHLLMSEQDHFRMPEQKPIGEYGGIEFVSDPFLKPGEYYLVNRPKIEQSWRKIEFEALPIDFDFSSFTRQYINKVALYIWGFDPAYQPEPYHWQRYYNEALPKWGSRLFDRGLLDDPEIRWAYQKTILSAPVKWANKLFRRT